MVLFSCSLYSHFIVLVACVLLLALLFDHDECYIEPACVLFALQCPSFLPHNSYHKAKPCSCHFMQNRQKTQTTLSCMKVTELFIVMVVRILSILSLKCNGFSNDGFKFPKLIFIKAVTLQWL